MKQVRAKVPFRFYRESLQSGLALLRAEEARDRNLGAGDCNLVVEAEEAARRLWSRWKLET